MASKVLDRPLAIPFELTLAAEATDDGNRIVEGYAATSDLDLQGDIIKPEALDKAAAGAIGLTVLLNHNPDALIGKVIDARAVRDGGEGKLWVKVEISNTEDGIWSKIRQGILNKFSIRGKVLKAHRKFNRDAGEQVNVVEELQLLEISLVAVPANPKALAVRAYVSKAMIEFVAQGGEIPSEEQADKEPTMDDKNVKGADEQTPVVKEDEPKAEPDKGDADPDVEKGDAKPKANDEGKAAKLLGDALAALKMDEPDVAAAIKLLGQAKSALGTYPAPAKGKGDAAKGDAPADAKPETADTPAADAPPVEDAPAKDATPAQPESITVDAMKEALDSLKKMQDELDALKKQVEDELFTKEDVAKIVAKLVGVKQAERE